MSLHKRLIKLAASCLRPSPTSLQATQLSGKMVRPFGLRLKKCHSVLLVARLEQPNSAPPVLIGAFSGAAETIESVLTGPNIL